MKDGFDQVKKEFYANLVASYCAESIVITDATGLTEWVNPAFVELTGFTLAEIAGKTPGSVLQGKDTCASTVKAVRQAVRTHQPYRGEILNYTRQGVAYWIDMSIQPIFDADGRHTHFISIERDITERKALEQRADDAIALEAHRTEERRLISSTSEWLYTAKSITELTRVVERAMHTIFPEAEGQLYVYSNSRDTLDLTCAWGGGTPPTHLDAAECWALRRGRIYSYGTRAIEFPCDHVDCKDAPYVCIPIIASGDTIGLMHMVFPHVKTGTMSRASLEDYLESRRELAHLCAEQISLAIANVQLRQELQDQSTRDPLTGLWNRRWFLDAAHREFGRASSNDGQVTLVSFDIDHFKKFNDHHGHDAGDLVLREVGQLMQEHFAQAGHSCRLGGEEFVVLLPGLSQENAVALANEFRETLAETKIDYAGQHLPRITISGGVAGYPKFGPEVVSVLKVADQALYAAKDAGRDTIIIAGSD